MFSLNFWQKDNSVSTSQQNKTMFGSIQETFGGWFWPLAILSLLLFTQAGHKVRIVGMGAYYFIFSQDKSFNLPSYDPGTIDQNIGSKIKSKQTKRLILVRHGESVWNEAFNRGINWKFPLRVLSALARETMLFVTSDSVFYDSPLGSIGISQAQNIHEFIKNGYINASKDDNSKNDNNTSNNNNNNESKSDVDVKSNESEKNTTNNSESNEEAIKQCVDILSGESKQGSIIISSPLRRCIETISLACFQRLNNDDKEQIHLISALQEMTRNVDGLSLSSDDEAPALSWSLRSLESDYDTDFEEWLNKKVNIDLKGGYKCEYKRGDLRMKKFVSWLFESNLTSNNDTIIISGHSLWFRFFFQAYYPRHEACEGKTQKIYNGGVVACQFSKYTLADGRTRYRIEPGTVLPVIKGFEKKKKKSS